MSTSPAAKVLSSTQLKTHNDWQCFVHVATGPLLAVLKLFDIDRDDRLIDSPYIGNGQVSFTFPTRQRVKFKVAGRDVGSMFGTSSDTAEPCDYDTLRVSVNVGCHCEGDCCGHLCGLYYSFTRMEGFWIVKESRSFNY